MRKISIVFMSIFIMLAATDLFLIAQISVKEDDSRSLLPPQHQRHNAPDRESFERFADPHKKSVNNNERPLSRHSEREDIEYSEKIEATERRMRLLNPTQSAQSDMAFRSNTLSDSAQVDWVSLYSSGLGRGDDYANAIAVDASGNVYVTGASTKSPSGTDYLTMKLNTLGDTLWIARYDGGVFDNDNAKAIAVDASGNVYVTGSSFGTGASDDYATIKYNSSGVQQWVARYNRVGNSSDNAHAIAVDASGNVYVTGSSYVSGTGNDYTTIKYNSSGAEQWVAQYNGTGNSSDNAYALAVDAFGNVYITGSSYGSGTFYDYATIKYNSSGVEQWVARYNGPGNSSDEASSLAIDASGNVYVTGRSVDSVTGFDYATIKYNSYGVEQWIARYNGTGTSFDIVKALAVDVLGNVYVTGYSYGIDYYDYITVKYNSSGVEQWAARYNGPGNSLDEPSALVVDASSNVYVTGESSGSSTGKDYATIKYDSSGVEQWVARYSGPEQYQDDLAKAIAVDTCGNVYVTGRQRVSFGSDDYYATVKYNSSGVKQWVALYNGPGNSWDESSSIAIDASGNVYVTGFSYSSGTSSDYATVKYNSSGIEQWIARYNGPGNLSDLAYAIAVDALGNIYVTGKSTNADTSFDYTTIKYNSSGVEQWVARYNGPGDSTDCAYALAVDALGNVYVTGFSVGLGTYDDYATIKYNSSGVEQWVARYDGPGNSSDEASSLAIDASGNIYVTGRSAGSVTHYDYATIKYNSSGVEQWVTRYNGPGNSSDYAKSIAVDALGNVNVTGCSVGLGTYDDYTTIKYNSSGVEQWVARYNGPGNSSDEASSLAIDASGNVYVTGRSAGSVADYDYATIKYSSSGVEQWVARYNGPGNYIDEATALSVDASGNVYVTGNSYGQTYYRNYVTVKYNSSGVEQWITHYNGPGSSDYATALAVDATGSVYVSGFSKSSGWSVYATIKYSQNPVSVQEENVGAPARFSLEQNYPNPFNPTTTISFDIPKKSFVSLKVFDIIAREVAKLISGELPAGYYSRQWKADGLSSGIYFYRLQTEDFVETKKLILLR